MSDLARLLQQYGYGDQPNALAQDAPAVDTSNVLAGMPRPNALADALRVAGAPTKGEHGFLFSNVGGELKFNPWEAIKGFMSYKAPPGALSTSGDDAPVRNSTDAAGWLGLSGLGLNFAGQVPKNALGIFGGRLAKTADHAALAKAEEMAAKGADRKDIWDQTGWFQGTDGKWRFEIDDSEAAKRWFGRSNMAGTMKHDALYDAYPDMASVKARKLDASGPVRGEHDPGRGWAFDFSLYSNKPPVQFPRYESIAYRNDDQAISTLLHEAQHAVQKREGFSGGRPSWETDYAHAPGEVEARVVQARHRLSEEERKRLPPWETRLPER